MKKLVRSAGLVIALGLTAAASFDEAEAITFVGPHECGEACSTEGQQAGCIDRSGPVWRKVICTCIQGHYVC